MATHLRRYLFGMFVILGSAAIAAEDTYVPPDLQPWVPWVLDGQASQLCPKLPATKTNHCAWPGTLIITADEAGAAFSQPWEVLHRDDWITLPGDQGNWPEDVRIDGKDAIVTWAKGAPSILASPGVHTISGRFRWSKRPQELKIPANVALIELSVDGNPVTNLQRNRKGLWLGDRPQSKAVRNSLTTYVYRLIQDSIPTRLTTEIRLEVSGSVREITLGPILPDGFVPSALESGLPARFEPSGQLRLQVRPGTWRVSVTARAASVLTAVKRPAGSSNWPGTEIWSFAANNTLRVAAPQAGRPVDPAQTDVPSQWANFPAFAIEPEESLQLDERSRGEVETANQLQLSRTLWLDFDGEGYTASDEIGGTMRMQWRLSMQQPFQLLSAYQVSESDNLLVTQLEGETSGGVEVRSPQVGVKAISRTAAQSVLPVSGWKQRFDRVTTQLQLPPAHRLLAAHGADVAHGAWINRWQLLDMFLVLFISVSATKLFGRAVGVLAVVAMILGAHEPGAPSWAWLNLMAGVAVLRVAPEGMLRTAARWYRNAGAVLLVALLVPFFANQLKLAIYPQLDVQGYSVSSLPSVLEKQQTMADVVVESVYREEADESEARGAPQSAPATASKIQRYNRYTPDALVQTGPGLPQWQWISYQLSWSGPVEADRSVRLIILPPWVITLWRIALVLTLGLLVAVVAKRSFQNLRESVSSPSRTPAVAPILAVTLLGALAAAAPRAALADTPSPELLKELRERLLANPTCGPSCGDIVAANAVVSSDSLRITLTVNALAKFAVRLPGSESEWVATEVTLDGKRPPGVYRANDGAYWLPVDAGRHAVELTGRLPATPSVSIPFGMVPRVLDVKTDGWTVSGVVDRKLIAGELELTRLAREGEESDVTQWESNRFPPYFNVRRKLIFDIDWFVETTVQRVAPESGAVTVDIPLLPGESVISETIRVENDIAKLSMAGNQNRVQWTSTLARQTPVQLAAPTSNAWSEIWTLGASNIWHVSVDGLPASQRDYRSMSTWEPVFHPRPGETLDVELLRPDAVEGSTLAFDEARLRTAVGSRSLDSSLSLRYRSTRGTQQMIELPPDAQLTLVQVDGEVMPLQLIAGVLRLPIRPGEHLVVAEFTSASELGFRTQSPVVNLGTSAGNIHTELIMPSGRWLLGASGEGVGPAVIYWSELAALALLALLLGRVPWTPLRTWQWFLLGLGFSTFSWAALAVVALWLIALGWRAKNSSLDPAWLYNLRQLGLGFLSLIAIGTLLINVPMGLLGTPDMHVSGNGSYNTLLRWFTDRSLGEIPTASAFSISLWFYKVAILSWALWLSFALIRWLPWAWRSIAEGGLWRGRVERQTVESP